MSISVFNMHNGHEKGKLGESQGRKAMGLPGKLMIATPPGHSSAMPILWYGYFCGKRKSGVILVKVLSILHR